MKHDEDDLLNNFFYGEFRALSRNDFSDRKYYKIW